MRRSYVFWVVAFVVFLIVVYLLRGILLPFVAGLAVAYFVDPVCDRLEDRGLSRTTATVLVTSVFFVIFLGAVVLLLPMVVSQISDLITRVPGYYAELQTKAAGLIELAQTHLGQATQERAREFLTGFTDNLGPWLTNLAKNVVSGSVALANLLSLVVITPIVAFYLLRDWDRLVATIDSWLPRHHAQTVRQLIGEVNERIAGFVRGQVTVCLILGGFYALALSLTGLEFGLLVGMLAGVVLVHPLRWVRTRFHRVGRIGDRSVRRHFDGRTGRDNLCHRPGRGRQLPHPEAGR